VSNLTTRPKDHNSGSKKTNDCSGCHNTNNWERRGGKESVCGACVLAHDDCDRRKFVNARSAHHDARAELVDGTERIGWTEQGANQRA